MLRPSVPCVGCQICSGACLRVRPGGAGIKWSMKGGLISEGMMGVFVRHMLFHLLCVSTCIILAGLSQVATLITLTQISSHN